MSINPFDLLENKPTIFKHSVLTKKDLSLYYRHDRPGELEAPQGFSHHLITIFLTENRRQVTHIDRHGEYDGKMQRGEFYLYPAQVSGFTRWLEIDKTLHLILKPSLLSTIAQETECLNPNKIELLPVLKSRDRQARAYMRHRGDSLRSSTTGRISAMPLSCACRRRGVARQIEHLAQLLLSEMQHDSFGKGLYLESLTDALAVHLLRNYCVFEPTFRQYQGGLGSSKLRQTIDYIQSYLDRDLSLETMAKQVDLSRYYFATQFKQAMGISPHQYVNQQRVERAKQLLKQTDRAMQRVAGVRCGQVLSPVVATQSLSAQSPTSLRSKLSRV